MRAPRPATTRPTTRPSTRSRMVDSTVALLRQRSSAGVTIDAVLAHSGAPRGSVYHHFPGGRDQLITEAVGQAGRYVAALIAETDGPPTHVVARFVEFWEHVLDGTDHEAGCPVVALTIDATEEQRALVREIFALWQTGLVDGFTRSGIDGQRATRLATLVIAAAEGAIILCRAERSTAPLRSVTAELHALLEAVVKN